MFNVSLHLILAPPILSVFRKQPGDLLQLCHQSFLNPWYHIPSRLLNTLLQGIPLWAMLCHQYGIIITETSHEHHGISNNRKLHHLFNNLFRLTTIHIHFCEARRASHCHSPQTTFSSNSTCCVISTQKSAMHVVVYAARLTTQHSIVDIVHWSWSYGQFCYPRWHVECFWAALAAH